MLKCLVFNRIWQKYWKTCTKANYLRSAQILSNIYDWIEGLFCRKVRNTRRTIARRKSYKKICIQVISCTRWRTFKCRSRVFWWSLSVSDFLMKRCYRAKRKSLVCANACYNTWATPARNLFSIFTSDPPLHCSTFVPGIKHWRENQCQTFSTPQLKSAYYQGFLRKMLGTRYGSVGTRFLWFLGPDFLWF